MKKDEIFTLNKETESSLER